MSDKSRIEWTDATWNPVSGCTKVSRGCHHCYAERQWPRLNAPGMPYAGRQFTDVALHHDRLDKPLRWRKPRRIFVNSMSDLFHEAVPESFIDQVFAVMALAPQHTFQVLTKRPERMNKYLADPAGLRSEHIGIESEKISGIDRYTCNMRQRWPLPLPNVWLGVSVEDQATADERIPLLLQTPAAVRWISAEPLLGPVNPTRIMRKGDDWTYCDNALDGFRATKAGGWYDTKIDWVVVGGESGPKARPMHPDWARSLRDQCAAAGVSFLFKQWGEWIDGEDPSADRYCGDERRIHEWPYNTYSVRVGKKAAGRLLDGRTWDEYPQ